MKKGEVGIDERLRMDADALAREVNAIDEAAVARRVLASVDASANVDFGASAPGRPARAAGPWPPQGPGEAEVVGETWDSDASDEDAGDLPGLSSLGRELQRCIHDAEAGDPSSARRAAELLELAGLETDSAAWWRQAAELGDPDAIDYVREILDRDSPFPLEGTFAGSEGKDCMFRVNDNSAAALSSLHAGPDQ